MKTGGRPCVKWQIGIALAVLLACARAHSIDIVWRELAFDRVHDIAASRDELFAVLHGMVANLVGVRAAVTAFSTRAEIVLPPYLDFVVFDVVHRSTGRDLAVFPPGASRPLSEAADGVDFVHLGNAVSTIVVNRPDPGAWVFRTSGTAARVRVFAQQFFPRGTLVVPGKSAVLRQHDRLTIAYQVLNGAGQPLIEFPGYPISVGLEMTRPDGKRTRSSMVRRLDLGAGVFAATMESKCELAGRYWTEVHVAAHDLRHRRIEVFRDRWSGFYVAPAMESATRPLAE
jgi:hypothetical protein